MHHYDDRPKTMLPDYAEIHIFCNLCEKELSGEDEVFTVTSPIGYKHLCGRCLDDMTAREVLAWIDNDPWTGVDARLCEKRLKEGTI